MGYTHYWSVIRTVSETKRAAIAEAVGRALYIGARLGRFDLDDEAGGAPIATPEAIFFNGKGPLSHETFCFDFKEAGFEFCKTAAKPYDVAVCAALVICKEFMGADLSVRSDGDDSDWVNGIELAQLALGRDIGFKLDVRK